MHAIGTDRLDFRAIISYSSKIVEGYLVKSIGNLIGNLFANGLSIKS